MNDDDRPNLALSIILGAAVFLCIGGAVYALLTAHNLLAVVAFLVFALVIAVGLYLTPPPFA